MHVFVLFQFGPHLFWTDWHTKSIESVDKDSGKNRIVIRDNIEYLMEIKMVAEARQTGKIVHLSDKTKLVLILHTLN